MRNLQQVLHWTSVNLCSRARDSPEDEEKYILFSTSNSVHEILNEQRIIRQGGSSQTKEYVYTARKEIDSKPSVPGGWNLQSALTKTGTSPPLYHIKANPKRIFPWK